MPIRDEPSFDPGLVGFPTGYLNDCIDVETSGAYDGALLVYSDAVTGWIIGSGAVATGSLNSLTDVDVSSAVTGQVLGLVGSTWQGITVTGIQGPTGLQGATGLQGPPGTGGGASTLDGLTDVSTTGDLQSNMWLGYNGAYWRQSYFDTTNLSNVSGHALVDQDHSLVYFPTVNKYISTHVLAAPSGLKPVDSLTYAIGNTNILQAALNKGGMVFLPSGNYLVTGLILSVADTVLFGQGVIKCYTGAICDAVVTINATGCKIRDIGIDGNGISRSSLSGSLIKIGRGEGLRVNGNNNLIDSVRIYNIPTGSSSISAGSYAVGDNNTFRNVFISGGDIAAFRNFGNNTYRDCISVGWGYKGFSHVGEGDLLVVDGFYSVCNTPWFTNGRCNFQIDPSTRYLQQASLTNIRTESTTGLLGNGDAAFKAALVGTLNINNCYLSHNSGVVDTIIIAEDVKNINIDNSTIAKHINFNISVGSVPNNFTLKNSTLGITGQWIANSNIFDLECSGTMLIENCTFYGFTQRAVDFDSASGTFDSLRITDCTFIGSGATVYDIDSTSTGLGAGNKIIHLRNSRRNLSGGNSVTSSNNAKRRILSTIDDGGMNYLYDSAPSSASDGYWTAGTRIYSTTLVSGGQLGWICAEGGLPGTWAPFGDVGNLVGQSYLTGVNDTVLSGIPSTGSDVTTLFKNFFNNIRNDSFVRISPGTYRVSDTVTAYGKNNVFIDARGCTFIEMNRLPSGTFWFDRCTGVTWQGGYITGADTMSYVLGIASGCERSGTNIESLAPGSDNGTSTRRVLGQAFNFNICREMTWSDFKVVGKYRILTDYYGQHIRLSDFYHRAVYTGSMDQQDRNPLLGTGVVTFGSWYKEAHRNTYSITIGRTYQLNLSNGITENCGGMIVAGTPSLGAGGAGNTNPANINIMYCQGNNVYDNGIYLSTCTRAEIIGCRIINDASLPHSATVGMKVRGPFVRFVDCYVEHTNNGYGFEGFGSTADYWTNFSTTGWTSQGSALLNSTAVDVCRHGVYLDRNNDIYTRDVTIQGNYFYECGSSVSGRVPTGYSPSAADAVANYAVISAEDGYRTRIIDNTIENSGSFAADYGIYAGNFYISNNYLTGIVIRGNKLLGQKIGIYLKNATYANVSDNYGERIGFNNYHHIKESGTPALIQTYNVRNSKFTNNMVVPTGQGYVLRTKPTGLWENNIVQDNIGEVQIN